MTTPPADVIFVMALMGSPGALLIVFGLVMSFIVTLRAVFGGRSRRVVMVRPEPQSEPPAERYCTPRTATRYIGIVENGREIFREIDG